MVIVIKNTFQTYLKLLIQKIKIKFNVDTNTE